MEWRWRIPGLPLAHLATKRLFLLRRFRRRASRSRPIEAALSHPIIFPRPPESLLAAVWALACGERRKIETTLCCRKPAGPVQINLRFIFRLSPFVSQLARSLVQGSTNLVLTN